MSRTLRHSLHLFGPPLGPDAMTSSKRYHNCANCLANMFASLPLIICLFLVKSSHLADALKIISIGVPSANFNSSSVVLSCHYDLQGDQLYSVKWYKDYVEFYRYQPDYSQTTTATTASATTYSGDYGNDNHNSQYDNEYTTSTTNHNNNNYQMNGEQFATTAHNINRHRSTTVPQSASKYDYDLNGIYLNLALSNATHAHLSTTNFQSEGTYKCEVSVDGPSFVTVSAERQMKIYVLPQSKLTIHNNRQLASRSIFINQQHQHQLTTQSVLSQALVYDLNETVNLTCSIGPARPRAELEWYINDSKAPDEYVYISNGGQLVNRQATISNAINSLPSNALSPGPNNKSPPPILSMQPQLSDIGQWLPSESHLIFQLDPYYLKQQHLSVVKSLRVKCVARITLNYSFESNIVVAGGKTIKKQSNSMPAVINGAIDRSMSPLNSSPVGASASVPLPLVMMSSPETFSHDYNPAQSSSSWQSSIYMWPQSKPTSVSRQLLNSATGNNNWRQLDTQSQQRPFSSTSSQQADQQHNHQYVRNRDFISNSQWSSSQGVNARDFIHQQQLAELNEHINYIQKLLIAFAPNEASQPEIEAATHKISQEDYELNDIIQFNCIATNHHVQPMAPPAQMRLKWFINNFEINTNKVNRYINGRFYYEPSTTNETNSVDERKPASDPSNGDTTIGDHHHVTIRPAFDQQEQRDSSYLENDKQLRNRQQTFMMANQRDKQQTAKIMRAKVIHQDSFSTDSNEQTTLQQQQQQMNANLPTRLPRPVSIHAGMSNSDHVNEQSEIVGMRTRRQAHSVSGRPATSYRQLSMATTRQQTEQKMQQYRHRQTIPLQIELDNSLYQLKELDIKCLLIVEQPIVEYTAQLSITNTPMPNNPAIKPSNIQQNNNPKIGQTNQAGFSDTSRMGQSNQSGEHHRQTNIDGKTQQSTSSSDSIHALLPNKILFVLLLIVMIL